MSPMHALNQGNWRPTIQEAKRNCWVPFISGNPVTPFHGSWIEASR